MFRSQTPEISLTKITVHLQQAEPNQPILVVKHMPNSRPVGQMVLTTAFYVAHQKFKDVLN